MPELTDPWGDYLALSEWNGILLPADHVARWPEAALPLFQRLELLVEGPLSPAVACDGCPEQPLLDVLWLEHPLTGVRQPKAWCCECGLLDLTVESLQRWDFGWEGLMSFLTESLGVRGAPRELMPLRLWRLGKLYWSGRPTTLFLARRLHRQDAADVLAQVAHFNSALFLLPQRQPRMNWPYPVLSLDLLCEWDGAELRCDIEYARAQQPPTKQAPKQRRPKKEGNRAAVKQRIRAELEAHVAAARDHVQAAIEFGNEPTLLPFPTYDELARRCATSKATISRCLQEERELKELCAAGRDLFQLLVPRSR